jgi:hypothetical protein
MSAINSVLGCFIGSFIRSLQVLRYYSWWSEGDSKLRYKMRIVLVMGSERPERKEGLLNVTGSLSLMADSNVLPFRRGVTVISAPIFLLRTCAHRAHSAT